MKIKSKDIKKQFEPFNIELTIESEEEARLLFHVFNCINLKNHIFNDRYNMQGYNTNILGNFSNNMYREFKDILDSEGVEI